MVREHRETPALQHMTEVLNGKEHCQQLSIESAILSFGVGELLRIEGDGPVIRLGKDCPDRDVRGVSQGQRRRRIGMMEED